MTASTSDPRPPSPSTDETVDVSTDVLALNQDDLGAPLWGRTKRLPVGDTPMAVWPAALALMVLLVVAGFAMELEEYPVIPLVLIAIVCIRSWNQRWARTVWYATLVAYTLWMVVHTVPLWLPFFFALLAAYILSPIVDPVERLFRRLHMPAARTVSVALFFVFAIGLMVAFYLVFIVQVSDSINKLKMGAQEQNITDSVVHNVKYMVEYIGFDPLGEEDVKRVREWTDSTVRRAEENLPKFGAENAQALLGQAAETVGWFVVLAFNSMIFLFATFYLLIGFPKLSAKVGSYFSPERSQRLARLSDQIGKILRSYLQGHTLACLMIGLLYFFILWMFGHPYAALLGLMMGVLSLIPFLGPIVAGILSVLLTLTVGLESAEVAGTAGAVTDVGRAMLAVVVAYIVSHGLNDTVIYPQVAGRAVHISPVETLLVLFVIGHFFGILGMFFAVPMWAIVRKVVAWMNEEHIPGFEWLKLFRPYEVRHERTLKLARVVSSRQASASKAEAEWAERAAQQEAEAAAKQADADVEQKSGEKASDSSDTDPGSQKKPAKQKKSSGKKKNKNKNKNKNKKKNK